MKNFVPSNLPKKMIWQYQITHNGYLNHTWVLKGEKGAVHIHAFLVKEITGDNSWDWLGGIEMHKPVPDEEANHKHCYILGGPCYHDGSSLQFSEQVAPRLPHSKSENPHDMEYAHQMVYNILMDRYNSWFGEDDYD